MKAISLKKPALLLPLPGEERQMNKITMIPHLKKAGLTTCLFLCLTICQGQATEWLKDEQLYKSYTLALNLQVQEVRKQLSELKTPEQIYIATLTDALELLVTEDESKFDSYEDAYESRLDLLGET